MALLEYSLMVLLLSWAVSIACVMGYMRGSRRVFSVNAVSLMSTGTVLWAVLSTVVVVKFGPSEWYVIKPWLPESSWLAHYLARTGG